MTPTGQQGGSRHARHRLRAVEAVLKMFDPDYNVRAISARRRVTGDPWSKRGTLFRVALDVLRAAPKAISVRQIADAILAAMCVRPVPCAQLHRRGGDLVKEKLKIGNFGPYIFSSGVSPRASAPARPPWGEGRRRPTHRLQEPKNHSRRGYGTRLSAKDVARL